MLSFSLRSRKILHFIHNFNDESASKGGVIIGQKRAFSHMRCRATRRGRASARSVELGAKPVPVFAVEAIEALSRSAACRACGGRVGFLDPGEYGVARIEDRRRQQRRRRLKKLCRGGIFSLDPARRCAYSAAHYGALAQLGERLHGMQEVRGSIPLGSTKHP